MDFKALGIKPDIEKILIKSGISEPTPVQEQSIPVILTGKDVIAQAQTGTGKTLAFLLPAMEAINLEKQFVQTLIITPTRELAIQITNEARKLMGDMGVNILAAYGGQDVEQQIKKLKGNIQLVIGTPGRLQDHIRRKSVDFSHLQMLVLDEADVMLDMGFQKEVEEIIHKTPQRRQTLLFSATLPKQIKQLASKYMRQPQEIRIHSKRVTLDEIKQIVFETTDRGKLEAVIKVINDFRPFMAIVFCRTKRRVSALNEALQSKGFISEELHGDLTQAKREKVMKAFRKAEIHYLIATDVAARGLDIEGVTHIFNYDIPLDTESYIHRIGRTGRAGQSGIAITFATPHDREELLEIEKGIGVTLSKKKIEVNPGTEELELNEDTKSHSHGKKAYGTGRAGFKGRNFEARGNRNNRGNVTKRSRTESGVKIEKSRKFNKDGSKNGTGSARIKDRF